MEDKKERGHIHPISAILRKSVEIFSEIGYEVADGPEMEDEFHNFDALNVPKDHPARDMQDTFWIKNPKGEFKVQSSKFKSELLRTHTSSVQIRFMEANKDNLPIKIIAPGKVFRNEATDATHEAQFHQLEGLYIDKNVSLADLKGTLEYYFRNILDEKAEIRLRPSYFPFVEPGFEVDVKFKDKWLEVGGAGVVHPKVLESVGIDSKKWRGFAFGCGPDRIAMIKHGIDDIRLFYSGDLRLVNQF